MNKLLTFDYPIRMLAAFKQNIEYATSKLLKVGFNLKIIELQHYKEADELRFKALVNVPYVYSNNDFKVEGFEFVGSAIYSKVKDTDGYVKTIKTYIKGYDLDYLSRKRKLICHHCQTQRIRNFYYFFRDSEGQIKRIGKDCAEEFFGLDVERMLRVYEKMAKSIGSRMQDMQDRGAGFVIKEADGFVGELGEEREEIVQFTLIQQLKHSDRDGYNLCKLVFFDSDGFAYVWLTRSIESTMLEKWNRKEIATIHMKIKAHNEWNGSKTTMISHVWKV